MALALLPSRNRDTLLHMKIKAVLKSLGSLAWKGAKTLDRAINDQPSSWKRFEGSDHVLVFVHGLLSEGDRAWSGRNADWPQLCAEDDRLTSFDIFQAEWYTSLLATEFDLVVSAEALLRDLNRFVESRRPVIESQRIVFICHSMGGLVVRQMLVSHPQSFANHRVSVLSFGTPALGVEIVNRLEGLISTVGHRQAAELKLDNPRLEALHNDFAALIKETHPRIDGAEFVESHLLVPTLKVHQWADDHLPSPPPLVGMESQGSYFGPPKLLEVTDHRTISRPDGPDHPSHKALTDFLSASALGGIADDA